MPIEVIAVTFGMLFSIGGVILAGQHMRLKHERQRVGAPEVDGLRESIEGLQDEVEALREEVSGMEERLDFTERLLSPPTDRIEGG